MTRSEFIENDNLQRMSELSNYKVEPGDPDPRGWTVVSASGAEIGEVEDLVVDTAAMKVRYLLVRRTGTSTPRASDVDLILLETADVELSDSSRQVLARRFDDSSALLWQERARASYDSKTGRDRDRDRATLTRSEEELKIGKREVERGEAVIGKHVETEHVSQPVTRRREEVVVERRPVEAGARGDVTIGEDEVRIPLREEEVIVEKRPVVKEELVVGKRTVEERDTVETEIRREEFDIDAEGRSTRDRNRNER